MKNSSSSSVFGISIFCDDATRVSYVAAGRWRHM